MRVLYYDPLNPTLAIAEFEITRVLSWDVFPVYSEDGFDYLYDKYSFTFQAVINDDAMSAPTTANTAIPKNVLGYSRHLEYLSRVLRTPRLQLVITQQTRDGTYIIFRACPVYSNTTTGKKFVAVCDVAGGPKPISFHAFEFHGLKSHLITWSVESWVNRDYVSNPDKRNFQASNLNQVNGVPSPGPTAETYVLSHRWSQSDSISEDMFTSRTTTGKVVLNAARIRSAGLLISPDDFRAAGIFHLLPYGFARTNVSVQMASDGNSLTYSVTDTEQPANIGAWQPLVSVEADATVDNSEASVLGLPQTTLTISVSVKGRPKTPRKVLLSACINVLLTMGFDPFRQFFGITFFAPCFHISSGYSLIRRTAWANASCIFGRNIINDLTSLTIVGSAGQNKVFQGVMSVGEYTSPITGPQFVVGPLPLKFGAYETLIEKMVAQAINNDGIAARLNKSIDPGPMPTTSFVQRPDNL